ncbi:hypothetical protein F5Y09DRAFT_330615 [Xylaria sp. FL1042]|nr:hypothetical protein F5Y09DRAFT_330615 [Xylaria sp. FL1042]
MNLTTDLERIQHQALSTTGRNRLDEIFHAALHTLQQHAPADFTTKIGQWATIEDVVCQVRIAEAKYSTRQNGKAWKWVTRLSGKIMFYAEVLDVIAQHHPEYVSLAWGAFKFVFIGVLSHETLIRELTKAMTRVADVVRHAQVQFMLYPTDELVEYMSDLYSHIMSFAIRAVEWYQKGKIAHALAAFASPFQLKFRDIVEDIYETSRKINRWAMTMNHVEIRQMRQQLTETAKALESAHIERREMFQLVTELKGTISQYSQLQYTGMLNTNQQLSEIQFSQIYSFISASPLPRPDLVRQSYNARRNRRQQASSGATTTLPWISDVQEWGQKRTSTQILVQGYFKTRHTIRDFAANAIDLIKEANIPVVWALDPRVELPAENRFNTTDVLKYLACQVLQINHTMLTERQASLSSARFQSAVTESEWLELLTSVLQGMNQIYFIVDMDLVERSGGTASEWLWHFARISGNLRVRNIHIIVKVAFICTSRCVVESLPPETKPIRLDANTSFRVGKRVGKATRRKQKTDRSKLMSAIKKGLEPT